MDVYSLINSKDIAEYLREIHYEFNSLETAWLIWKNDYLTFDEKKEKWHEVIETMPDCEVSEREGWHAGWERLKSPIFPVCQDNSVLYILHCLSLQPIRNDRQINIGNVLFRILRAASDSRISARFKCSQHCAARYTPYSCVA